jgi:uncharacterized protein YbjT (DUF2867 family)
MTTILITGATGTVASELLRKLEDVAGVTVRAAVRSAAKGDGLRRANITPVEFDYERPVSVREALEGADGVFLCTPLDLRSVAFGKALVDSARAAGVKRIVKLSAIGSEEPRIQLGRSHREVEQHIEASGLSYTFLRPTNFMENFVNYYPPAPDGNIYLPWGNGACSFIAAADIARVAAVVLTKRGHENTSYTLTGPAALTAADVARTIGEASDRAIRYVDVPEPAARKAMLDLGMPEWMVDATMELHAVNKAGHLAAVYGTVQEVTGRAPLSFKTFAQEHRARWKV